ELFGPVDIGFRIAQPMGDAIAGEHLVHGLIPSLIPDLLEPAVGEVFVVSAHTLPPGPIYHRIAAPARFRSNELQPCDGGGGSRPRRNSAARNESLRAYAAGTPARACARCLMPRRSSLPVANSGMASTR